MVDKNPIGFKIGYILGRLARVILFIYILNWLKSSPSDVNIPNNPNKQV